VAGLDHGPSRIRHCVTHLRQAIPFTITDLVSERAWLSSELGTLMRPDWGRNYQMAIPVPYLPGSLESRVWVLGRFDRDFTPGDRSVASHTRPISALTERESLVLHLLDDGLTVRGIAARLLLSRRTVHKHIERIYRKLKVHDRITALATAHEHSPLVERATASWLGPRSRSGQELEEHVRTDLRLIEPGQVARVGDDLEARVRHRGSKRLPD
jgi:DNA-binding CsgD family transcriptional regulator